MTPTLEPLDGRKHFAAGTLDPAFGTNGSTSQLALPARPSKRPSTRPTITRVDSAGRTVIVNLSNYQYTISRLTADGTADTKFAVATGGSLDLVDAYVADLEIDANNRIYVLSDTGISRFTSSGKLDKSFGGDTSIFGLFHGADMTFDSAGSIWVVGTNEYTSEFGNDEMAVARLDPDGQAVTAFHGGVFELPHIASFASPGESTQYDADGQSVRLLQDGSVVVLGSSSEQFYLSSNQPETRAVEAGVVAFKFLANGKFDKNYGKNGMRAYKRLDPDVEDARAAVAPVGIRGDGSVVLLDSADSTPHNRVLTSDGGGGATIDFGRTLIDAAFVRQPDGADLVLDRTNRLLDRHDADGSIDPTFNGGTAFTGVTAATIGTDGSVLLAGPGANRTDARFIVRRVFGSEAPAGRLVPTTLVAADRALPFRVVWRDDDGVAADTITGLELRVIGPDGSYYRPRLTGKTDTGATVIADYVLKSIDGRTLSAVDNGLYAVRLLAGRVKDIHGNATAAQTLGTLVIRIA